MNKKEIPLPPPLLSEDRRGNVITFQGVELKENPGRIIETFGTYQEFDYQVRVNGAANACAPLVPLATRRLHKKAVQSALLRQLVEPVYTKETLDGYVRLGLDLWGLIRTFLVPEVVRIHVVRSIRGDIGDYEQQTDPAAEEQRLAELLAKMIDCPRPRPLVRATGPLSRSLRELRDTILGQARFVAVSDIKLLLFPTDLAQADWEMLTAVLRQASGEYEKPIRVLARVTSPDHTMINWHHDQGACWTLQLVLAAGDGADLHYHHPHLGRLIAPSQIGRLTVHRADIPHMVTPLASGLRVSVFLRL